MRRFALLGVVVTALVVLPTMSAAAAPSAPETFTISGELDGLFPGFNGMLPAKVSNPFDQSIRVTSLAGSVADPVPGCSGSELTVANSAPDVVIAAGATMTVPVAVALARSAPTECQGVTFEITFVGVSVGSDGSATPASELPGALAFTGTSSTNAIAMTGVTLLVLGILLVRRNRWAATQ